MWDSFGFEFVNFYFIPGLVLGCIYALGAIGITLTFKSGTNPDIAQVQVQNKLQLATPLLPPSASSAKSTAEASAARARAVAAKARDGSARRNLSLSRPRRLLSAGASPPVCLSFAGWLSRHLLLRASASRHLLLRSRLTRPDNGNHPLHCRNC